MGREPMRYLVIDVLGNFALQTMPVCRKMESIEIG